MLVSAVTGDVGAGKSTLTACWRGMGASVIDADEIVRSIWRRPETVKRAVSLWGEGVVDEKGAVVHSIIADAAFSSPVEYRNLCDLVHPAVRIEMERAAASLEGWVVAEIPLLFEGGLPWWIDLSVYVAAPADRRAERNRARGWNADEITRRERFLLPTDEKKRLADYVVENSGSLDELLARGEELGALFKKASGIVRCSMVFDCRKDADDYCGRLTYKGLGAEMPGRGRSVWILEFLTLESKFALLPPREGTHRPRVDSIRRMSWPDRLAVLGALSP